MEYYFITGVSSGIGLALVNELLAQPQELLIHGLSRRDPKINDERFHFHALDLSDLASIEKHAADFFRIKPSKKDRLVLINNAGMLGDVAFVGQQQAEHYMKTFAVNTVAPIILCEAFFKRFQELQAEKIIFNISSGAANKDIEGWAAYCASKAALDRFTMVSAQEQTHKEQPIEVYSISPGVIDTAMQAEIRASSKEKFPALDRFLNLHKDGELLPSNEAAHKIMTLLQHRNLRNNPLLSLRNI